MKKILSVFAAAAVLFGFASCSGDMHEVDSEKQNDAFGLAIVGMTNDPGNHVIPMNLDTPDGSEQSLEIKFTDGCEFKGKDGITYKLTDDSTGSWRGSDPMTASHFKVVPLTSVKADATPDWNAGHYGSLNGDNVQYIKAGEDYQKIGKLGDAGVSGDPKHLVFDGATAGETYILRAKYDSAKGVVQLKLDGVPNNPAEMRLNIVGESKNFPAKDKDGKDIMYSMTQAGMQYTYDFIATADEDDIEFYITNSLAGTFGGDLETGALELNAATTQNLKFSVKKNIEYKLTLDISAGINKATIKGEIVSMLENATINGNWYYADKFYEVKYETEKAFYFQAENTDLSISVRRAEGDGSKVWGSSGTSSLTTITVDAEDDVELSYLIVDKTTVEVPVKVNGLTKGNWYLVKLTEDKENFTLKAKVSSAEIPDIAKFNSYMWSNVNNSSWGQDTTKYPYPKGFPKFVKDSTQENTFYCDFSPVDTSVEFGIKKFKDEGETDNISEWYGCGAEIKGLNNEASGDITKGNSKIIDLEAGKNYRLYVTFLNPVIVSMKVIEK